MEHGPVLIPDWTLAIQFLFFVGSFLMLKHLVFRPYIELLKLRESRTSGLKTRAQEKMEEAKTFQKQYEEALHTARASATQKIEQKRREFQERERIQVSEASSIASKKRERIRAELESSSQETLRELLPKVPTFSREIASKMIARNLPSQGHAEFIEMTVET